MAIVRWRDPFDIVPEDFFSSLTEEGGWPQKTQGLSMYETEESVVVEANVAGVPAKDVDISYEGGTLTIKAEHEETEEEKEEKKTIYKKARAAKYYYTTSVPSPVKPEDIEAEVENGVVKITLPRQEAAKPKRIKVKAK